MRLNKFTILILFFSAIQIAEFFVFKDSLVEKSTAQKQSAEINCAAPKDTPINDLLEKNKTSLPQSPSRLPIHDNQQAVFLLENSKGSGKPSDVNKAPIDKADNDAAFSAASQVIENATNSGIWTEANTETILENKNKLTDQQLNELTAKFYMQLDSGTLELQGSRPPL